jgi:hypothetical protein
MNRIKNSKSLTNYKSITTEKYRPYIDEVIKLYLSLGINEIKQADKLVNRLSSRGKGPETAVKIINELKSKDIITKQKQEISRLKTETINQKKLNDKHIKNLLKEHLNKKNAKQIEHVRKYDNIALNGSFREINIDNPHFSYFNADTKLENINVPLLIDTISSELRKLLYTNDANTNFLTNIIIKYEMMKFEKDEDTTYADFFYNSSISEKIHSANQINEWSDAQIQAFLKRVDELTAGGSGWILVKVKLLTIQIAKSKKTRAGSYIKTPAVLASKHAIVNIKNKDDKCILWALLANKYYDTIKNNDKNELYNYRKYENEIKIPDDLKYPIDIQTDVRKIEKLNDIKINVFRYNDDDVNFKTLLTVYNTTKRHHNVCNLLLLKEGEKEHLVWIKDINKLLRTDTHCRRFWCSQCLNCSFESQEKLDKHQNICFNHEAIHAILPTTDDNIVKFKNFNNKFKHPFSCFLDFESTLLKVDETDIEKSTTKYQKHDVNSVGIKYNCIHDEYSQDIKLFASSNSDEVLKFTIESLEKLGLESYKLMKQNEKKYDLTNEERIFHNHCKNCTECNTSFSEDNKKVIHHDHITGKYISSLCSHCNLNYKYKKFMPVYIHNLKGYDSHFLIPALNRFGYKNNEQELISAIPCNEEKYISFSKDIKVDECYVKNKETGVSKLT